MQTNFFFIFGCWLLAEKFSICPKNNGFARVSAHTPMATRQGSSNNSRQVAQTIDEQVVTTMESHPFVLAGKMIKAFEGRRKDILHIYN